jgi:hypothetical protein
MPSRDILRKAKGDHLDQVHSVYSDQMVLVTVRQEAGKNQNRLPIISGLVMTKNRGNFILPERQV